jgi:hypothetical protein
MNMQSSNDREIAEKGFSQIADRRRFLKIAGSAVFGLSCP